MKPKIKVVRTMAMPQSLLLVRFLKPQYGSFYCLIIDLATDTYFTGMAVLLI